MSKVLDTRSGMKGNGRVANPKLYTCPQETAENGDKDRHNNRH